MTSASTSRDELLRLLRAEHSCIRISTLEESYALELLAAVAEELDRPLWAWSAVRGLHLHTGGRGQWVDSTENAAAALYHVAEHFATPLICVLLDVQRHLDDARTLRALREVVNTMRDRGGALILIDHDDRWPMVVSSFSTPMELALPDTGELEQIIKRAVRRVHKQRSVEIDLKRGELDAVIRNLRGLTRRQAEQIIVDVVAGDRRFDESDIPSVLARKRQQLHMDGLLEYVEAPVTLDSVGGLENLKQWLRTRDNTFDDKSEAFGLQAPRGVLLLGVQGAGKSLSAKAFATAWKLPLLRLDPGALYDRYIGESERRLRQALHQAEIMSPVVLWVDEIEKGFASAASHSNDGGLSQRMFGTLLTWMQEHTESVFLVATANDIEALPPELLRKGRFDEIFFVDLPDCGARRRIFEIHLSRRDRDPKSFDVAALAESCEGYSGAEIEQAIVSALHDAFVEQSKLTTEHIAAALRRSPPLSVTMAERIAALRQWAQGRCALAN